MGWELETGAVYLYILALLSVFGHDSYESTTCKFSSLMTDLKSRNAVYLPSMLCILWVHSIVSAQFAGNLSTTVAISSSV